MKFLLIKSMERPYYVHTPRNYLGESLVGKSIHSANYKLRSIYKPKEDISDLGKNLSIAKIQVGKLNDEYITEMASFGEGI